MCGSFGNVRQGSPAHLWILHLCIPRSRVEFLEGDSSARRQIYFFHLQSEQVMLLMQEGFEFSGPCEFNQ
jgi:hypothetical protein